jgi:hypothetical protein
MHVLVVGAGIIGEGQMTIVRLQQFVTDVTELATYRR